MAQKRGMGEACAPRPTPPPWDGAYHEGMRRYLAYLALGLVALLALPPLVEDLGLHRAARWLALLFVLGGGLLVYALSGIGRRGLERLGLRHLAPGVRILEFLGYLVFSNHH